MMTVTPVVSQEKEKEISEKVEDFICKELRNKTFEDFDFMKKLALSIRKYRRKLEQLASCEEGNLGKC